MSVTGRRGSSRSKPPEIPAKLFDAEWVAKQIKIPVKKWPLNCYAIASAILQAGLLPEGRLCYGHYFGEISAASIFASSNRLAPRHGWIGLPHGWVYDPTRWVFTATPPKPELVSALAATGGGLVPDYDLGGERFMQCHGHKTPPTDEEIAKLDPASQQPFNVRFPRRLHGLLRCLFNRTSDLKIAHVHYLGTRGPHFLGPLAKPLYQFLVDNGQIALIPIDFRNEVLGPDPQANTQVERWMRKLAKIRDELREVSTEINDLGGVTEDAKELMDEVVELLSRRV